MYIRLERADGFFIAATEYEEQLPRYVSYASRTYERHHGFVNACGHVTCYREVEVLPLKKDTLQGYLFEEVRIAGV